MVCHEPQPQSNARPGGLPITAVLLYCCERLCGGAQIHSLTHRRHQCSAVLFTRVTRVFLVSAELLKYHNCSYMRDLSFCHTYTPVLITWLMSLPCIIVLEHGSSRSLTVPRAACGGQQNASPPEW